MTGEEIYNKAYANTIEDLARYTIQRENHTRARYIVNELPDIDEFLESYDSDLDYLFSDELDEGLEVEQEENKDLDEKYRTAIKNRYEIISKKRQQFETELKTLADF